MFRNRKRKVSPDKKPDRTKKLKVSNKIFRSPSTTKPNSEAKAKLSKLLPDGYDSIILTANTKPDESFEGNEAVFGCVRLPILTKEDAMVWVKKFETKTFTSYRTQRTWKKDVNTGLFKRKYICNVRNKDVAVQSAVATCKGSIIFTIKDQEEIQANPDYYLRDYPSQVIIHFCHNHKIDPDSYMKNLRPTAELRIIFGTYFAKGHSPFSALICHKCDLHSSYGAEFYNVVSNGAICPSYNWCFHEYEKFFMRKFIEPPEDKLYEKLIEAVNQYNAKWRSEFAAISYSPMFVLAICTPLMKSIFRSGFAEELITVRCFSTPKTVPKRQKLILFLCHTPIGSLPFGVVVTFAEDTENVCEGIRALIKMFGVTAYSPKTIIIDENALISKSLKKCFPTAQILFNEFQMLQSIWRIIKVVCPDDDEEFQALYQLFLVTLNSSSEEEFSKNFDSLLVYAEKYPKLTNFLKYFKVRSTSYVLYARPKIEFNTDVLNYTDSGTIILQDVSIKYGNFFNIVQLFDFVSKSYVDHYERKLNKICDGDLKGFFKTNFYVPLSKIADFTCEKISDTEFLVSLNEMKFFVNAELDTCTCQVGVHGGSCVHQYIVEKNLGLVPECYTPLCEDMLGIFKNILKEKNIKPPLPDNDRYSELEAIKSELDGVQDVDEFSDVVSSVCCSEISNFSGMPHDMDHLCPMEEIFLAPPDINESFTDITDEAMSPLVLSEFDDNNEDNEDFLDDSQQYNRESGELEPVESAKSTQISKTIRSNVLVEAYHSNLEQSIPTTGYFLNQDNSDNVIIYEYTEDDIKCNNEVEIMEHCGSVDGDTLVHLPTDGSIVYTYSGEKQDPVAFYEDGMNESDRKTAEIAEFLTNLPDTNNSNPNTHNIPRYILDKGRVVEQKQTISNGVVVVRNEEYFTNYEVLENNVLSVVTDATDAFPQNFEGTTGPAQNLITDSYEDNNFVMMSPNDLFDNKQDVKINVLSSVVIKPPAGSSPKYIPTYTSSFPINLNAIKHKTLRNVKEDSRIRMSEQKTQSGSTIFIHDPSKSEPRKIVLPIVKKESNLKGIKSNDENKGSQSYEKDVIKLYCNQSSEKPLLKDDQAEAAMLQQAVLLDAPHSEDGYVQENVEVLFQHTQKLCQSEDESQELEEDLIHTEVGAQESDKEAEISTQMVDYESEHDLQEFETIPEGISQTYKTDTEEYVLADCNPEELAKNEFVEIVEIDSDGLEELASQKFDPPPSNQASFSQKAPVKVISLKNLPSNMIPFKSFSKENTPSASKCIPLREFMSKIAPSKVSLQQQLSSEVRDLEQVLTKKKLLKDWSPVGATNTTTGKQVKTTLSQQQKLAHRSKFKMSQKKSLGKPQINKRTHLYTTNKMLTDSKIKGSWQQETTEKNKKITEGNPNFLKRIETLTEPVELNCNQSDTEGLSNTHELKQESKEMLLHKTTEIQERMLSENKIENASANFKQAENIKYVPPLKSVGSTSKTFKSKTQELNTYKTTPDSDSNESSVSDFEDISDSFGSIGSGIDELSEDELYELQYLWDDSTDESVHDEELDYREPVKQSNKLGVKPQQKNQIPTSSNPQSDDNGTLQYKLPPGITVRPIKKVDKVIDGNSKKTDDHVNQKLDSSGKLPDAITRKQIWEKSPSRFETKNKSAETSKRKSQDAYTVQKSRSCAADNDEPIDAHFRTNKDKEQLLSRTNQKMDSLNKKRTKKTSVPASRKKSINENAFETNYDEDKNFRLSGSSDYVRTSSIGTTSFNDNGQNEKTSGTEKEKTLSCYKESTENGNLSATPLIINDQSNILAEKHDITYPNRDTITGKKVTGNKTKEVDTKMFNLRNKKLSNTTVKLDSLPNILLRPDSRPLARKNKIQVNENTNISKGKEPTYAAKASKTDMSVEMKVNIVGGIKKQGMRQIFPKRHEATVRTPKLSLSSTLDISKSLPRSNRASDRLQSLKELKPTTYVPEERTPIYQNPGKQMGQDIDDLEAILTSDKDVDRSSGSNVNYIDAKNMSTAKILENDDLSFLFDDPRFETVVEEEILPSPTVAAQGTVNVCLLRPNNKEIDSNITPAIMMNSDIQKENIFSARQNETAQKEKSSKKNSKRKLNASLDTIKKEPLPQKMVKYTDNSTQQAQESKSKTSKIVELFKTNEPEQNRVITLLVYATVPKGSTANIPTRKSNTQIRPLRKILPKPEVHLDDNNLSSFSDGRMVLELDASKQNVKETNPLVSVPQKGDLNKSSKTVNNISGTNIQNRTQRTLKSKTDKLELSTKKNKVQSNEANRTRRCNSTKKSLITETKNTLNHIESESDNLADVKIKRDTPNLFKNLEINMLDSGRRSTRSEILVTKNKSQMKKADVPNRAIFAGGVRTRSQSRESGDRMHYDNNYSCKYMETPSKMAQKQISLKKGKITNPDLVQKKLKDTAKKVKNQKQNQHKGHTDIVIDEKRRSVPSNLGKTAVDFHLTPKKERRGSDPTDNGKRKRSNKNSYKISLPQEDKVTYSVKDSISKLKTYSTFESSPTLKYESDDFENSIAASVLAKQLKPKEEEKGLISSTPRRSIGYEDAYKIFLETSNRWPSSTDQSQSDFEKDINDRGWELSGGSRRRSKSVSSSKEQSFDNKKLESAKIKKSVSWAEGLNVIEYIQESDTDSDDSEIRKITNKRASYRANLKKRRNISREENRITSKCADQNQPRSRSLSPPARVSMDDSDREQTYQFMLRSATFKGRRMSLVKSEDSFTFNRLTRSRSATPNRESSEIKSKRRSKSCSRTKKSEIKLFILLERNKEIDQMCFNLRDENMSCSLRSRGRKRIGYKELLHRARSKKFDT